MYGGGFDGGGFDAGGQFGNEQFGGGAFGGGAQFGADQFGGAQGGGGGFMQEPQIDNSAPDGKPKGNKDRQSLIPVTIKQLKNAPAMTNGEQGFTLDGRDLYQVTAVGLITQADEQATNLQYTIDDGTDMIMVKMWVDADADDQFAEKRAQWKEGVIVRVIGTLRSFNNTKSIVAYSIQPITDKNEYTFHFIEVVHTHLRHTKGPPPAAAAPTGFAAPGGYAAGSPAGGMGMAASSGGPAPMQVQQAAPKHSINDLVLKFFQHKGESNDAGATIADAAGALASNGLSPDTVRTTVNELVDEGHLYSTIDDDHFKATS